MTKGVAEVLVDCLNFKIYSGSVTPAAASCSLAGLIANRFSQPSRKGKGFE